MLNSPTEREPKVSWWSLLHEFSIQYSHQDLRDLYRATSAGTRTICEEESMLRSYLVSEGWIDAVQYGVNHSQKYHAIW